MTVSRWCLAVIVCVLWSDPSHAQQSERAMASRVLVQRVEVAFQEGNPERLLTPAADRIEITLFGARTFYTRSQAFYVLEDFFKEYGPRRFEARDVTEAGSNTFVTGRYWHVRADRPLRVYVRLSDGDDQARLHEVRIEPTRD